MNSKVELTPKFFFFLSFIEGIIAGVTTLLIPSDPKNALVFGYSLSRLILVIFLFLFSISFIFLFFREIRSKIKLFDLTRKVIQEKRWLIWIVVPITWAVIWLPAYQLGQYKAIYTRMQPLLIYLSVLLLQLIFFSYFKSSNSIRRKIKAEKSNLVFFLFLSFVSVIWFFMIFTGIGLKIDFFYWGGGSVPILPSTIFISFYFSLLILRLRNKYPWIKNNQHLLIPLAIYLVAVIAWMSIDYVPTFFAPKPVPPNYEVYPYSDAHLYDITAQSLMVGEGYLNRGFVQRPLYGFLLFLFHSIGGQEYFNVIFFQILFLALIPVLLFLIGKRVHSSFLGMILAIIAIIREVNGQHISAYIEVANVKLLMSDIWAGLIILSICFLLIRWYQTEMMDWKDLILASIIFSLGLLIRLNILFMIFPILFIVLLKTKRSMKQMATYSLFFGLISFVVLIPWMYRNYIQIGEFGIENTKFELVIQSRYNIDNDGPGSDSDENSIKKQPMIIPEQLSTSLSANEGLAGKILEVAKFTTAHFLHNEVHSLLILPNSFFWNDVEHLVNQHDYFYESWEGEISWQLIPAILFNLVILGLGLAYLFKRLSWLGLFPLIIHLFYNLSNGFARVSGWRYVIVTDWVIYFYFVLGLLFVFQVVILKFSKFEVNLVDQDRELIQNNTGSFWQKWVLVILLGLIPLMMTLPEIIIKSKFQGFISKAQFFENVDLTDYDQVNITEVNEVLSDPEMGIINARALYPRYYDANQGEPGSGQPWFSAYNVPNLGFSIVGPVISGVSIKSPTDMINFPNASEVYILGKLVQVSPTQNMIEGELVLIVDNKSVIKSQE